METIVNEFGKFINTYCWWIIGFIATMLIISICCIKLRDISFCMAETSKSESEKVVYKKWHDRFEKIGLCLFKISVITFVSIMVCLLISIFYLMFFSSNHGIDQQKKYEQQKYEQRIKSFDSSALIGTQVIKTYKTTDDFHTYQTIGIKAGYKIVSVNLNNENAVKVIFEKIK